MPSCARKDIVPNGEVGVYHCVNRCVRRAWLCGHDPVTGSCYDHRKQWIEDRLEELAGSFAVDVCGFSAMSNHVHVVLRTRPDVAEAWSDEEVARRWWRLFPKRRDEEGEPAEPEPQELRMLTADESALAERRRRLADLSWFMRCLSEPIAQRANAEDHVTGRFWNGWGSAANRGSTACRTSAAGSIARPAACDSWPARRPRRAGNGFTAPVAAGKRSRNTARADHDGP